MAKANQKKDEHGTQIVVAMIAAAGVIIAGALGAVGAVISGKSNGQQGTVIATPSGTVSPSPTDMDGMGSSDTDDTPTRVYVTSVSMSAAGRLSVTWKFTGTVKPSPGGHGAVFVLGKTEDGSHSVNSNPVSIDLDGAWVAVVGPIPKDLAWTMKWIVAYGEIAANDSDDPGGPRVRDPGDSGGEPRASVSGGSGEPRASDPDPHDSDPDGGFQRKAVTDVPKRMLPPQAS